VHHGKHHGTTTGHYGNQGRGMSDITYARKADQLSEVDTDGVPERLALAQVHATQAVARAGREIDSKLRYVADRIAQAMPSNEQPERWISWGDEGERVALAVNRIVSFEEAGHRTRLELIGGEEMEVPISYGTVALMVGA
jgi:hypothetical protein